MKVSRERLIQEFNLRPFGAKGWMNNKNLSCPFCGGGGDKFGIYLNDRGSGSFHCMRCDQKGSIFKFLKKIGRMDLLLMTEDEDFTFKDQLENFLVESRLEDKDLELPEIGKPVGFKPITSDEYLEGRGWTPSQFEQFHVGTTIEPTLKDKITFLLYEEGRLVGYLSRSKKSKEWHKENLEKAKKGLCKLVLRYDNSKGAEFEKIVGGLDEIVEGETVTVILVEGIMDKANTDKVLGLNDQKEVKCCFTFGCKLSDEQMLKIFKKGVQKIILLYDSETIQQVKSTSLKMTKFFEVLIGEIIIFKDPKNKREGMKDPGEMNLEDFEEVFSNLKDPFDYFVNRVATTNLK